MNYLLRLRGLFVSPLAVALCSSLNRDSDSWVGDKGYCDSTFAIKHSSDRFMLVLWDDGVVNVYANLNTTPYLSEQFKRLDRWLLARAIRKWCKRYSGITTLVEYLRQRARPSPT